MLTINDLHASIHDTEILRGVNLSIQPGEVHVVMGPNGSGKTTLSSILAGREEYKITQGDITFNNEAITSLSPDDRAKKGIFLGMQYPVEIPGVNNSYFLKTALNSMRRARGESELDAYDFLSLINTYLPSVGLDESFLKRSVNTGFSGGEKKRNEILQMLLFMPTLAILDEIDSGLDVDALKIVVNGINKLRDPARSLLLITHYDRLLNDIAPDVIHILMAGKIVKSGDASLAKEIETHGYTRIFATGIYDRI